MADREFKQRWAPLPEMPGPLSAVLTSELKKTAQWGTSCRHHGVPVSAWHLAPARHTIWLQGHQVSKAQGEGRQGRARLLCS